MPWRNGMGVTLEIAREPDAGDEFQWRLSLARVASSGPFSSYPGYQRSVTLIEGDGFQLGVGGQEPLILERLGATASFPGGEPTHCTLINGACTDLSLMVRAPGVIVSVNRIQDIAALAVPLEAGALKAVFCLLDGAVLNFADDPMAGSPARAELRLALHDTVLLGRQVTSLSLAPVRGTSADLLLLTWKAASTGQSRDHA